MTMPRNLLDLFTANGRSVPYEPAQNFLKAHTIDSFPDRAGNGDDVFKGDTVKFYDREEHRQGYNPPHDKEEYVKHNEDVVNYIRRAHLAVAQRWMEQAREGNAVERISPILHQVAAKY